MNRPIWVWILFACCAICAPMFQAPTQSAHAQAPQENSEKYKTLAPPTFIAIKSHPDALGAQQSLDEIENKISPPKSTDRAAPSPNEPDPAWLTKARTHMRQREPDQAMQLLLQLVRTDPKNILAWREIGRILDGAGRRETALSAWNQVLSLEPNDAEALVGSGLDFLAGKKFLPAAEKLFLARRIWLTVEPTDSRLKMRIATAGGLGLALRELGYARAAATCFHDAVQFETELDTLPNQEKLPRKQSKEFLRFAGECEASIDQWSDAATSFSQSLAQTDTSDAASLPLVVWALSCSGEPDEAWQLIKTTLAQIDSPGRAGAPLAITWLFKSGLSQPLQADFKSDASAQDGIYTRSMLAIGDTHAVDSILSLESAALEDPIAMSEATQFLASRQGVGVVLDMALDQVQKNPMSASRWATALRALPIGAKQLRGDIQRPNANNTPANNATRALLAAWFDLVGFDSLLALRTIEPFIDSQDALASASRIVALKALAIEQDLAQVERIEKLCDVKSCDESVALAAAFLECGETEKAIEHVEKAIALNKKSSPAWMVRAAIDLSRAMDETAARNFEKQRETALEVRNSLERAMQNAPADRLPARKYLQVAVPDRSIAPDEDALEIVNASQFWQVRREYFREKALQAKRRGQSEVALESLRLLFMEDPLDVEVGQALVSAAVDTGRLIETEKFLEAFSKTHPAVAELGEADLSCKAQQDRLLEVIQILKSASASDPDSDALTRGCVRSLIAAGKTSEAWSVMMNASDHVKNATGRSQLERIEFALSFDPNIAAQEIRNLSQNARISKTQRQSAISFAHRLPKNIEDRLALQSALAMPLLNDAQVQPMYLAYAMLNATVDEAHALSKKFARPWTVSATIEAAQMLADEGMFMKAESLLHDVGALNKAKDQAQLFRAELASIIAQGNTQRASARLAQERSINKFLIKDPRVTTQAEDLAELGNAFLMASNAAAASECFQSALYLAPDLASAMNNLAWLRMEHNQIDSATIDLVKRALAMTPNDPSTLDTAGWLAYRQGQLLDSAGELGAISLLRQSIEQSQDRASAESMDHYADALYRTGATGKAVELWRLIEDSEANKSSRENVVKAFQILQQREWGIRAWNADAFYDRNDGAAIDRAAKKLKAIAKGEAPELADMDFAQPSPAPAKDLSPSQGSATSTGVK